MSSLKSQGGQFRADSFKVARHMANFEAAGCPTNYVDGNQCRAVTGLHPVLTVVLEIAAPSSPTSFYYVPLYLMHSTPGIVRRCWVAASGAENLGPETFEDAARSKEDEGD